MMEQGREFGSNDLVEGEIPTFEQIGTATIVQITDLRHPEFKLSKPLKVLVIHEKGDDNENLYYVEFPNGTHMPNFSDPQGVGNTTPAEALRGFVGGLTYWRKLLTPVDPESPEEEIFRSYWEELLVPIPPTDPNSTI